MGKNKLFTTVTDFLKTAGSARDQGGGTVCVSECEPLCVSSIEGKISSVRSVQRFLSFLFVVGTVIIFAPLNLLKKPLELSAASEGF